MAKYKVLFVAQEIVPYLNDSHMGQICRELPQGIQEKGREIRTFMPRFGCINERRNQLHEVIRLSGMNLIIDDTDHPLIIKVASIQSARLQVYFIDNEDYFQRKATFADKSGLFFSDNDERAIFYARGVIETVKKLGWSPDLIHVHGWFSSLVPFFIKTAFKNNPLFSDTKIVCSLYDDDFKSNFTKESVKKLKHDGVSDKDIKQYKSLDYLGMMKGMIDFSDAIIQGSEKINNEVLAYAKKSNKPMLPFQPKDKYINAYSLFYDELVDELINEDAVK
ncbi:MAG TPA: glycogen/starch synthase [Bacteroidales bacterium]|nr:glycogen/starch synthase [Bacteroidales bacterium]HPB26498.1 glycogen/starch synthase [Bacteroidales bacterium]HQN16912.1 glycogen/starch synthase [Bacteroidales bacterium]HQP16815.1 glycogen/starch synthase [Bacteroidales bacterium]